MDVTLTLVSITVVNGTTTRRNVFPFWTRFITPVYKYLKVGVVFTLFNVTFGKDI